MSRRNDNTVWIRARLTYTTEKAIQIQPANHPNTFWLPKSQVVNLEDAIAYLTELSQEEAEVTYTD